MFCCKIIVVIWFVSEYGVVCVVGIGWEEMVLCVYKWVECYFVDV